MNNRLDTSFDGFGAAGIGEHLVPEIGRERLQSGWRSTLRQEDRS
jgi:hypothetical protein